MTKDDTYTHQKLGVYCVAQEYIVHVRTVTIELTGKPRNRTFLPFQLGLNTTTDVYHLNVSWLLALN